MSVLQFHLVFYCITFLISYLIGSIPFGLIISKLAGYGDIRAIGSGNIGATNVLRTGSKILALTTLSLDALKGIPLIIFLLLLANETKPGTDYLGSYGFFVSHQQTILLCIGLFAILGHCFPVWLKFKGGKGVATTFGVLLAAVPFAGMLAALTWILSALAGRMSSLAAISAMVMAPAFTYAIYGLYPALINVAISALVIYRHKDNIKRIRAGTEPKIGEKKSNPTPSPQRGEGWGEGGN
jgi:glycerol-3-phosphate acyltransferase PlsY